MGTSASGLVPKRTTLTHLGLSAPSRCGAGVRAGRSGCVAWHRWRPVGSSGFQFDSQGSPYFRYKATMRHLSCIQNALRPKGACFLPDFLEKNPSSLRFCNFSENFWDRDARICDAVSEIKFNPLKIKCHENRKLLLPHWPPHR